MNSDWSEFFALLNARKIEFLVIGGTAYNFHAPPRATKDVDLWVRPERANIERLVAAIRDFGFPTDGLDLDELVRERRVLMLGRPPQRIDLLTRPEGLEWEGAWQRRISGTVEGQGVSLLDLDDLIASKRAAGRPRDLVDAEILERIRSRTRPGS